jgi:Fe-S-cluster containining protein
MSDLEETEWVTHKARFELGGSKVEFEITVPGEPIRLRRLLPVFQHFTNLIVDAAVTGVEAQGRAISCKAGCGACCRQLVPISEMETFHLRDLVDAMPEPRRSAIRQRFAEARTRLESAGLLAELKKPSELSQEDRRRLGNEYFKQGIACPFLEEESCSIHPDRPLSCREYLVTSPAENCARPQDNIEGVPLAGHISTGVFLADSDAKIYRWVPLILALDWAESHEEAPPSRNGVELFDAVISRLTDKWEEGV